MTLVWGALHLAALLLLPILVVGLISRVKALWSGRKGPPLWQAWYDLRRLLGKRPIYSNVTTPIFRVAPYVVLATALIPGLVVPLLGAHPPVSFAFDFIFVAYAWGLGRMALMLGALDTGSSFEGMGASREATYAALIEPVLFLVAGTLGAVTDGSALVDLLQVHLADSSSLVVWAGSIVALFVLLQVESARIPVDDPTTHLELTMIHEVMILDHGGPDLAALQYAAAIKLTTGAALLATLLNPLYGSHARGWLVVVLNLALTLGVAVTVGMIESLIARLKLKSIPQYVLVGLIGAVVALLASTWRSAGAT